MGNLEWYLSFIVLTNIKNTKLNKRKIQSDDVISLESIQLILGLILGIIFGIFFSLPIMTLVLIIMIGILILLIISAINPLLLRFIFVVVGFSIGAFLSYILLNVNSIMAF